MGLVALIAPCGAGLQPARLVRDPDGIDPVATAGLGDRAGQVVAYGALGQAKRRGNLRRARPLRGRLQRLRFPQRKRACCASPGAELEVRVDDPIAAGQLPDRLADELRGAVMDEKSVEMCRDGPLEVARTPAGAQDRAMASRKRGAQRRGDSDPVMAGKRGSEQRDVRSQGQCGRNDLLSALNGSDKFDVMFSAEKGHEALAG